MVDVFAAQPENQSVPLEDYDAVSQDAALLNAVSAFAGAQGESVVGSLSLIGRIAGSAEALTHARKANIHRPHHESLDRFGRRADSVEFHPSWHWLMERGVRHGIGAAAWRETGEHAHLRRGAAFIAWSGMEQGHVCPLTMTYAAVPALKADPTLAAQFIPGLTSRTYEPSDLPADRKAGLRAGMGMTEKQGGSDVRTNVTQAAFVGDEDGRHVYRLQGHKWFTSAPTNDLFLVLAQAPGGLSCFVVPRMLPDGSRNPIRIVRLKDKLGNRSNASSELEFYDTTAYRLGDEGRGVRTIIEMVSATRLDCVLGSAGIMRRCVAEATWYAQRRHAFGAALADQPAMTNVLADLALESEAATLLGLRLAASVDHVQQGADSDAEAAFRRIALPLAKFWVCKRTPMLATEALECLGGNGYVEDSPMPMLFRESPLNSIWEGAGNVNALDVLRALAKSPASAQALADEIHRAHGADARLDDAAARVMGHLRRLDPHDAANSAGQARALAAQLAKVLQASLLVRFAPSPVADAFLASRIDGEVGVFGALPSGVDAAGIARRATPQR